jgi:hypothetical protein
MSVLSSVGSPQSAGNPVLPEMLSPQSVRPFTFGNSLGSMLYKLTRSKDRFDAIDPLPFWGLPREKELEDLLAENLWDVLFEGNELMPILQERAWQAEADIYALDRQGDLFIFELKRDDAGGGAVNQCRGTEPRARRRANVAA